MTPITTHITTAARHGATLQPMPSLSSHLLGIGGKVHDRYTDTDLERMTAGEFEAVVLAAVTPVKADYQFDAVTHEQQCRRGRHPNGHFR